MQLNKQHAGSARHHAAVACPQCRARTATWTASCSCGRSWTPACAACPPPSSRTCCTPARRFPGARSPPPTSVNCPPQNGFVCAAEGSGFEQFHFTIKCEKIQWTEHKNTHKITEMQQTHKETRLSPSATLQISQPLWHKRDPPTIKPVWAGDTLYNIVCFFEAPG